MTQLSEDFIHISYRLCNHKKNQGFSHTYPPKKEDTHFKRQVVLGKEYGKLYYLQKKEQQNKKGDSIQIKIIIS